MQMGEVVTILTSASGYSLVKSFSGTDITPQPFSTGKLGAVRRMRTRIRLLAQPESMRSIVGATQ